MRFKFSDLTNTQIHEYIAPLYQIAIATDKILNGDIFLSHNWLDLKTQYEQIAASIERYSPSPLKLDLAKAASFAEEQSKLQKIRFETAENTDDLKKDLSQFCLKILSSNYTAYEDILRFSSIANRNHESNETLYRLAQNYHLIYTEEEPDDDKAIACLKKMDVYNHPGYYALGAQLLFSIYEKQNKDKEALLTLLNTMTAFPSVVDNWCNPPRERSLRIGAEQWQKESNLKKLDQMIEYEPDPVKKGIHYMVKGFYQGLTGDSEEGLENLQKAKNTWKTEDTFYKNLVTQCILRVAAVKLPADKAEKFLQAEALEQKKTGGNYLIYLSHIWQQQAKAGFEKLDPQNADRQALDEALNKAFAAADVRHMQVDLSPSLRFVSNQNFVPEI